MPDTKFTPTYPSIVTTKNDNLKVSFWSHYALKVSIELRYYDGEKLVLVGAYQLSIPGTRALTEKSIPLADGILHSVQIRIIDSVYVITEGICFSKGEIIWGSNSNSQFAVQTIFKSYIGTSFPLSFPYSASMSPQQTNGDLEINDYAASIGAPSPIEIFPGYSNSEFDFEYIGINLTTDANAATRRLYLFIEGATPQAMWHIPSPITQAASLTYRYGFGDFSQGTAIIAVDGLNLINIKMPKLSLRTEKIYCGWENDQVGDVINVFWILRKRIYV